MKRILIYTIMVALALAVPVKKLNVAELEPVEVVYLNKVRDTFVLTTDTGAQGEGKDALSALTDLKEKTSGVVYLDTAGYLLVGESALTQIDALRPELKGKVKLCMAENVPLENAARFLKNHGKLPALGQWKTGQELPFWNGEKIIEKQKNNA